MSGRMTFPLEQHSHGALFLISVYCSGLPCYILHLLWQYHIGNMLWFILVFIANSVVVV